MVVAVPTQLGIRLAVINRGERETGREALFAIADLPRGSGQPPDNEYHLWKTQLQGAQRRWGVDRLGFERDKGTAVYYPNEHKEEAMKFYA